MKLLDQLDAACRTMNFASTTIECYRRWVEDYLIFHRNRAGRWIHPNELRETAVEAYLAWLARDRRLSASSQHQGLCALVFLYRSVLKQPLGEFSAVRAKRPERVRAKRAGSVSVGQQDNAILFRPKGPVRSAQAGGFPEAWVDDGCLFSGPEGAVQAWA